MLFTAVALNPSIDKMIIVNNFKVNATNRISDSRIDPSGKGINVAKVAKTLGEDTCCTGFLFDSNGNMFEEDLRKHGIKTDFVWCSGEVRTNIKVVDPENNTMTEINNAGQRVGPSDILKIKQKIEQCAQKSSIVIFSGSLPPGTDKSLYRELIEICNRQGARVYLDTYGEALKEGIKAKPFAVKPNTFELELTVGEKLNDEKDIVRGAKKLIDMGLSCVLVSRGSKGSIALYDEKVYKIPPINVPVKSSVAAGDSLLTGFAIGMKRTMDFEYSLKLGTACATSCVIKEGSKICTPKEVEKYFDMVEINQIF